MMVSEHTEMWVSVSTLLRGNKGILYHHPQADSLPLVPIQKESFLAECTAKSACFTCFNKLNSGEKIFVLKHLKLKD